MNTRQLIILALAAVLLAGCSDNKASLEQFVAGVRSQPSPPIEPIPEIRNYTPYTYAAGERRPPFTAVVETRETQATSTSDLRPDPDRPLGPLEAFPLDSLKMVGTMTIDGVRYALLHAPDDVVYRVSAGGHAGKDYGEITAITADVVMLAEIVPDGLGGFMRRPTSIPLSQ